MAIVLYCIVFATLRVMTGPEYWRPRAVLLSMARSVPFGFDEIQAR